MQDSFQPAPESSRRAVALQGGRVGGLRRLAGLVALATPVLVWVLMRRPEPGPSPAPPSPMVSPSSASAVVASAASDPKADQVREIRFESFSGGARKIDLVAASQTGRESERRFLDAVRARIPFVSQGKASTALVEADHAQHVPSRPSVLFQGHVRITTDDGLVFNTEELLYDGKDGTAISQRAVAMKRKDLEIEARGMIYDETFDAVEFIRDVRIRLRDPDDPPADIAAGAACLSRGQNALFLQEGVRLDQGRSRATSGSLELYFREDHRVQRALFRDGFELRAEGDTAAIGFSFPRALGSKTLRGRRLDVAFGEQGEIQEVAAGPEGEMIVEPGPGDLKERRELRGEYLVFKFDEQGRMREYLGQVKSEVAFVPLDPSLEARTVRSRDLVAIVDPATGVAENIDFIGDVEFTRGSQRGTGSKATFKELDARLTITGGAAFTDENQRLALSSSAMDIDTKTGSFQATGGVRHTQRGGLAGLPIGASGADVLATSRRIDYDAPNRRTTYSERAVVRAGADELRAAAIETIETGEGPRILATGDVEIRATGAGDALEARSNRMTYAPGAREFLFEGAAALRLGALETRAPALRARLAAGAGLELLRLESVGAGPVAMRSADRVADGASFVFTPADGRVQLDGGPAGPVKVESGGQRLQGRRIVFFTTGDQIEVTGVQEGRTETVILRKVKQ